MTVGFVALAMAILAFWQHGMEETLRKKRLPALQIRKQKRNFWLVACGWLTYVTVLSHTNLLTNAPMPLRVPALVVLPVLVMITYFFWANKFDAYNKYFPKPMAVYGQTFRIAIELLVYASYVQGVIPAHATFEGYNLSIVAGLTAPVIGSMAFLSKTISPKTMIAWNIAGLALLAGELFIFLTTLLCSDLCKFEHTFAPEFNSMPYVLLLSVFIPSSVFMHMISIAQALTSLKHKAIRHYHYA